MQDRIAGGASHRAKGPAPWRADGRRSGNGRSSWAGRPRRAKARAAPRPEPRRPDGCRSRHPSRFAPGRSRRNPRGRWDALADVPGSMTTPDRQEARDDASAVLPSATVTASAPGTNGLSRLSGRGAGYPAPPPQIPACGFPAPGSYRKSSVTSIRHRLARAGPIRGDVASCDRLLPALSPEPDSASPLLPVGSLPSTASVAAHRSFVRLLHRYYEPVRLLMPSPTASSFRLPVVAQDRRGDCGRHKVSQVPT